jgi:hypothetical protein
LVRGKRVVIAGLGNRLAVFFMGLMPHALLLPIVTASMRRVAKF